MGNSAEGIAILRSPSPPSRAGSAMHHLSRIAGWLGCLFGYLLVGLSVLVSIEAVGRKAFAFSLQGVDELGGYVLAVGSSLAFTAALVARGHIRIDLFHSLMPRPLQAVLNWLSAVAMAAFGALLAIVCLRIIEETIEFGSTAPTPWATPLIWPQAIWYAALVIFAVIAIAMAIHATVLFFTKRWPALARHYGPKLTDEEVHEELADLKRR
jgi:TRAP-type C4-dicarboxylate transport system permease small subunit